MKKRTVPYAVSGALAGAANGLFGAGGGMILVPLLTRWCKVEDRKAFSTAIAIILPLCIVSLVVYLRGGALDFRLSLPYLIGGLAGGILGGLFYQKVPVGVLHKALGILILWGGVRMLFL